MTHKYFVNKLFLPFILIVASGTYHETNAMEPLPLMTFRALKILDKRIVPSNPTNYSTSDVCSYNAHRDEQALCRIALANIYRLTCGFAYGFKEQNKEKACKEVMSYIQEKPNECKVILRNGETQGFITYSITLPWYKYYLGSFMGNKPYATIHHLAVDEKHRNNGYASQLINAVIDDCKLKSVNKIFLVIEGQALLEFYKKFGFDMFNYTKLQEYELVKKLR